ncbi:EIF2S2 [Cordylochernes scorpioides]|uniref:Eukaryotic translation initiation factor 2 subunit 2 n=1 Tax=Cordylochernes scorpioides TaxID=51811 RepID=A0ABY6KF58_9ARAC|nr:EIF2S2 [Cordylochernes scorpioides]
MSLDVFFFTRHQLSAWKSGVICLYVVQAMIIMQFDFALTNIFDPSLKKKKKKKKTPFDLTALEEGEQIGGEEEPVAPLENGQAEVEEKKDVHPTMCGADSNLDLDDFSGTKKKKKKKKAFNLEELDAALPEAEPALGTEDNDDLDFNLAKKKKKKKRVNVDELEAAEPMEDDEDGPSEQDDLQSSTGGNSMMTDREYTYDELLQRVFNIMREKNPDMVAGEKRKFVMRPPQVLRVGTKKSSFANFLEICKMLHRQPKHLQAFLLAELGTSGSVDANNQLIIKGRFQQKQIENVLRRYIKEYVTCHTCRAPETILQKDTRLFFLQCESCGSRCSVASIKSGFQAVTGKRAAIRAKNA